MKSRTEFNSSADWQSIVSKVQDDDPEGRNELQRVFSGGVRFYLNRALGPDQLEARVQEAFLRLIGAIKAGELREQGALPGLVRTAVLELVASYHAIDEQYCDKKEDLDTTAIYLRRVGFIVTAVQRMSLPTREAFDRYYVQKETQEGICEEMKLSEMQFLGMKTSVKAAFAQGEYAA